MTLRRIFALSASAFALAIAAPALAQDPAPIAAPAAATPAYPQMNFGTWGVDTSQLDTTLDPGEDFNAYVNGKWIAANAIPADRTTFGAFHLLREHSIENVQALMNDLVAANPAPGTPERRIVDSYSAFLDQDAINAAGLAPAMPYLANIWQAPDLTALAALFQQPGYPGVVAAGVTVDDKNPDTYTVGVNFSGMGMPGRDYYLVDNPRNLELRGQYREFLEFMLGKAGYEDPANAARAVYAFEQQVAELEWAPEAFRNPELTYNSLTRDELLALVPEFPMATLLATGDFADQANFLVPQLPPTAEEIAALGLGEEDLALFGGGTPAMMRLLLRTDLATLKAFMTVRFLSDFSAELPADIDAAHFAFYGAALNGQPTRPARWKRAIAEAEGQLGEQLGALYVARYFPPESKARMDELVANLRRAMGSFLDENSWMTPATLAQARAKLDTFMPMIGYPDEFEQYAGLHISAADPLANQINAGAWAIADMRGRLGGPVDKTEWGMLPQTVNAYYNPGFNQIVFPAAILQAPFFNAGADPAVNYGAIGAVIGHEMGHAFDDEGSQYDSTGRLRDWWSAADRAAFEAKTARMADLIDAYCPLDNGTTCLSSGLAMGETLGDVVGLQMAYRAFRMSLNGVEAPVIDGLTGDQRFFLGFGQVWREKQREAAMRAQMIGDPHPPSAFRLNNAVRHLDAWYAAFGVEPGDALYLPPEERITIW